MKSWLPAVIGTGLAAGVAIVVFGVLAGRQGGPQPLTGTVADGEAVYATQCAACHGTELEGQPDWQAILSRIEVATAVAWLILHLNRSGATHACICPIDPSDTDRRLHTDVGAPAGARALGPATLFA